jgi:hypothetical protein
MQQNRIENLNARFVHLIVERGDGSTRETNLLGHRDDPLVLREVQRAGTDPVWSGDGSTVRVRGRR